MNWGYKIAIVYGLFAVGMLTMVFVSTSMDTNLVEDNYYEKELAFQHEIDMRQRVLDLDIEINAIHRNDSVFIQLPFEAVDKSKGTVNFMHYASRGNDKMYPLMVSSTDKQCFNKADFLPGKYEVQISWVKDGKEFYWKGPIVI